MKKLFIIVVAVVLLCGFRAPNGNIISKGDLADKLIINLGEPHSRINMGLVQVRVFGSMVFVNKEIWTYRIDQYNYRFIIMNGQIVADDWSRF